MRQTAAILSVIALLGVSAAAPAAKPEIERPAGAPQADGVAHTVRVIPEACARLEGTFTGQASAPYRFAPVRSSATCQPRARLLDPAKARPSSADGWILNDVIRVPSKACTGLVAVVEVWRWPGRAAPPKLDAQGRSRLYLREGGRPDAPGAGGLPAYAAKVSTEGRACG